MDLRFGHSWKYQHLLNWLLSVNHCQPTCPSLFTCGCWSLNLWDQVLSTPEQLLTKSFTWLVDLNLFVTKSGISFTAVSRGFGLYWASDFSKQTYIYTHTLILKYFKWYVHICTVFTTVLPVYFTLWTPKLQVFGPGYQNVIAPPLFLLLSRGWTSASTILASDFCLFVSFSIVTHQWGTKTSSVLTSQQQNLYIYETKMARALHSEGANTW